MKFLQKLFPFLIFIISYSLGSYIYLREPRKSINRLFILIMLSPFFDPFLELIFKILKIKFLPIYGGSFIFIIPFYIHFLSLMGKRELPLNKLNFIYLLSILLYLFNIFYKSTLLIIVVLTMALFLIIPFVKNSNRSILEKFEKKQFKIIVLGLYINLIYLLILIYMYDNSLSIEDWKLLSPLILIIFVGFSMIKYRISNIWLVFRKGFAYGIALTIFISSYFIPLYYMMSSKFMSSIYFPYISIVLLILFAIIFQPMVEKTRKFIDTSLFSASYYFPDVTEEFIGEISTIYSIDRLIKLIKNTISKSFKCEKIYILDFKNKIIYEKPHKNLEEKFKTIFKVEKKITPLIRETRHLDELIYEEGIGEFLDKLMKDDIILASPIYVDETINWIIFLGRKNSQGNYNSEDIQFLATISNSISSTLQKIDAFNEMKRSNEKLKKTVKELKETKNELERQEKLVLIGKMAATIAHEVRNPLGIIKISASTLSSRLKKDSEEFKLSTFINSEVDKLNHVVTDLLDFTRESELILEKADLNKIIELAIKKNLVSENIKINFKKGETTFIECNSEQLERVFTNLIKNSLESENCKNIDIVIENNEKKINIYISDDGSGISEEDMENIFEPFFTRKKSGNGLGLAVCSKIITSHHGNIYVDKNYKNGCKMVIEFPKK